MAGNSIKQPQKSTGARKIGALALVIVVAIAAYTGFWFYSAQQVETETGRLIARVEQQGNHIECGGRQAWGYPFRIGIVCESLGFAQPTRRFSLQAGELRTAAQIYRPRLVIGELASPALLNLPGAGEIALDWERMRASVRLASPLPERISVESQGIHATLAGEKLFTAARTQLHVRPNGAALDIAAMADAVSLHESYSAGLPQFDVYLDANVRDGIAWLDSFDASLRGHGFDIRRAHLDFGEHGKAMASGELAVRADGHVDADLTLQFAQTRRLGAILAEIFPASAETIRVAADNLAFFGDNAEIPLRIEAGKIFIGPFEIGALAPLP